MIVFLFGPPGSGKTYLGNLLQKNFGFSFYDADRDMPPSYIEAANLGQVTDQMETQYMNRMIQKIPVFLAQNDRLVVSQLLLRNKHRQLIRESFPEIKFVLVETADGIRKERVADRGGHPINQTAALAVAQRFEAPAVSHQVFSNNDSSEAGTNRALSKLLQDLSNSF